MSAVPERGVPAPARAATPRSGAVAVAPVSGRRELAAFLRLPWLVNAGDPHWVPPLLADQKKLLDRRRHPFHQHADAEYFLARRGGRVAGRIAAIVNHRHNAFHDERTGFFGFFESVDDDEVATALLATAGDWLRARGMERVLGPMNFSTNEECGLLIDGFETAPRIMMPHNPRYYARLLDAAGYGKAKDLLAYYLDELEPPRRLVDGAARIARHRGIVLRSLDMRRFQEELAVIKEIYNSAWERNWGFVPMTEAEVDFMARELRPVVKPELCVIAEVDGQPAGFALGLPDFNQALRHVNGRLFPFGLVKLLWHMRRIDGIRVLTLGLRPGYRSLGLGALLYLRLWTEGVRLGYRHGEASWILEDNWEMRRPLEHMGARIHRTYRIYEKPLDA
jgi:GNAT superfamily N-acetyltransferase